MQQTKKFVNAVFDKGPIQQLRGDDDAINLLTEILLAFLSFLDTCREPTEIVGESAHRVAQEIQGRKKNWRWRFIKMQGGARRAIGRRAYRELGGDQLLRSMLEVTENSQPSELDDVAIELGY